MSSAAHWELQRERSTVFMLRVLVGIARLFGRRVARLLLYPSVAYFLLAAPKPAAASRAYLQRVLGRAPRLADRWRHFFTFASCTLDRVFLLAGRTHDLDVRLQRAPQVQQLLDARRGAVLLLAHVGSFESMRVTGDDVRELPLRIVMDRAHGGMYTAILERLDPALAEQIVDSADRGPELVLTLKAALERGEIVCLMADRVRADEPVVHVSLLGGEISLPIAPWVLAGLLQVPVITGFALYRGGGRYDASIDPFVDKVQLERRTRNADVQRVAQQYAQRLEKVLRDAPYNWFNFYDYWR